MYAYKHVGDDHEVGISEYCDILCRSGQAAVPIFCDAVAIYSRQACRSAKAIRQLLYDFCQSLGKLSRYTPLRLTQCMDSFAFQVGGLNQDTFNCHSISLVQTVFFTLNVRNVFSNSFCS